MQYQINSFFNYFGQNYGEYGMYLGQTSNEVGQYTSNFLTMNGELDEFLQSEEGQALQAIVTLCLSSLYSELFNAISSQTQNGGMSSFMGTNSYTGMHSQNMFSPSMFSQNTNETKRGRGKRKNRLSQFNNGFGFEKTNKNKFPQQTEKPQYGFTTNSNTNNWEVTVTDTPVKNNTVTKDEPIYTIQNTQTNNTQLFEINEKIEASQQGVVGDCWLLSGLNSLSYSTRGQKLINDAITPNSDGSYTVTFAGVGKSVNVTQQDLLNARKSGIYSSGDDDVLLMEVAFEKIIDQVQSGKIKISGDTTNLSFITKDAGQINSIDGGWLSDMIYLLTGDELEFITNKSSFTQFLDEMEENPQNYVAKLSFPSSSEGETDDYNTITDIYGNKIYTLGSGGHAFAIKSVQDGTVTIVNPHDSSKEYTISYEELIYSARNIEYYEL